MESYIQICTGEFKMQNDQNIYYTSNLCKMLENQL